MRWTPWWGRRCAAEQAAAKAVAATAASQEAAQAAPKPAWKPGERATIAEIKDHANGGATLTSGSEQITISERYLHVRWAGSEWRAKKHWTWEPQSRLIADVPELVGAYCRVKKLVVPPAERTRIAAAMLAEAAEADELRRAARAPAPPVRPPSRTPIPGRIDMASLLQQLTTLIAGEAGNADVRTVELPATATAAQRRAHEDSLAFNEETQQTEPKVTIVANDQRRRCDDKAAQGRARYKHGTRMAIISEDEGVGTGFYQGAVYQVLHPAPGGCDMQTKAGALLLEGVLEVGCARVLELRKHVGNGSVKHPRSSVRRFDAAHCEAVLLPLARGADGLLREDRTCTPLVVPLLMLGCRVDVREFACSRWRCISADVYEQIGMGTDCGGTPLTSTCMDRSMFSADAMAGDVAFEDMKVADLREELAVRGASRSGLKGALQRRLHTLIVQAAISARHDDDDL